MKVLVVVLNYRTPKLVIKCLETLEHEVKQIGAMHVVVPDNNSGDGSVEMIGDAIEKNGYDWCTLLALEDNAGYCAGNNAGIRPYLYSDDPPDYVMLVNPDAYIRENAVSNLIRFMEANPDVGIGGSRIEDPEGEVLNGAFRFPSPYSELVEGFKYGVLSKALKERQLLYDLGADPMPVDWVVGAAMIIRKQVFLDVGLLDEGYFLYFDEVDYCLAARRAGWPAYYVPDSVVVHLQAQATGITDHRKKQKRYPDYWFYSRRRFFVKNHGKARAVVADLAFLSGYTTYRMRRGVQRKPDMCPPHFLWDFFRNSTLVKGFDVDVD